MNIEPFQFGNDEPIHFVPIRDRLPLIRQTGVAAEAFHAYANTRREAHVLDVLLLTFVLQGDGRHRIGDREHAVSHPSVDVTFPGEPHCLRTDGGPIDEVNVYLDVERRVLPRLATPLDDALARILPPGTSATGAVGPGAVGGVAVGGPVGTDAAAPPERVRHVPLDPAGHDALRPLLDAFVRETHTPRTGTADALDGLLRLVLVECARAVDLGLAEDPARAGEPDDPLERVRLHLEETYAETHTLAELAQMAHLERTYFSRVFARRFELPVSEYILRLRIRYVLAELQRTSAPISTIAAAAGFRDISFFGRSFRRVVGITPSAYRRAFRESAAPVIVSRL